jgi:hydroxymethylbilane synthase
LVRKNNPGNQRHGVVATGSLRRKAQWLRKYPEDRIDNLRGNVQTRLQKLEDSAWDGAIFAAAGLERLEIKPEYLEVLDWMLPAPAQGALMVAVREDAPEVYAMVSKLNHPETEFCVGVERHFLRALEGGCTAPIGAYAGIEEDQLKFEGAVFSLDGREAVSVTKSTAVEQEIFVQNGESAVTSEQLQKTAQEWGQQFAQEVLQNGGDSIMEALRKALDS